MPERSLSVTRRVPVDAARLFAALSDPMRHAAIDGSGMVRRAATTDRITKVGDVFRMVVFHPAAGEYQTDNHVVQFEPLRRIGWWWIWELGDEGEFTAVTHTYDWSRVTDERTLEMITFPLVGPEQMAASIERLAAAAA